MASKPRIPIPCPNCCCTFTATNSLNRHLRKFHPTVEVNNTSNNLCCICRAKFRTLIQFQEHFQNAHPDVVLEYIHKTFISKTAFELWKSQHETETMSSFTARNSAYRLADNSLVRYYYCHRSGSGTVKEGDRKPGVKSAGINKIGTTCPAHMKVIERPSNGQFEVTLQQTHVGHKMEIGRLLLLKDEKKSLAVPKSKILAHNKTHLPIPCPNCCCTFTATNSLNRHLRKFHPTVEVNNTSNNLCCICSAKFRTLIQLQEHFQNAHPDVVLEYIHKTFISKTVFELWKSQHERETMSSFTARSSAKRLADNSLVRYYYCHRSGSGTVKEGDRKRQVKSAGINKIGATCPAHMKVIERPSGQFEVTLQQKHVGHKMEIGRLLLSKDEKRSLAIQMSMGVPKSKILADLRENNSTPTKRIDILRNKDLHNICRQFNINVQEKKSPTKRKRLTRRKDLHNIARDCNISQGAMYDANATVPNQMSNVDEEPSLQIQDRLQEQQRAIIQIIKNEPSVSSEETMAEHKTALISKFHNLIMNCETPEKLKMLEDSFSIVESNLAMII